MRPSFIRIEIVAGPDETHGGVNGANITIDATGPHDTWQVSCGTELDSLREQIASMANWPDLVKDQGWAEQDRELAYATPLEQRFELVLLATPRGPAVQASDTSGFDGIRADTRVYVTVSELKRFVHDLAACLEGTELGACLGMYPHEVAFCSVTRPLLEIGRWRIRRLDRTEKTGLPVDAPRRTREAAARFFTELAAYSQATLNARTAPKTQSFTNGDLTIDACPYCDDEDRLSWHVSVGSVSNGPGWRIRMSPYHCLTITSSVHEDSLTLYGYVSDRFL